MRSHFTMDVTQAICTALRQQVEDAGIAPGSLASLAGKGSKSSTTHPRSTRGLEPESSFTTLATTFVSSLAHCSPMDLCTEWLLDRLHCLLVENQFPMPGEIELIRADIQARADVLGFSAAEKEWLTSSVVRVLHNGNG
jgi:hypothetical protein